MKDKSILEIDTGDIQSHYHGTNISYDDLVKFAENEVSSPQTKKDNRQHNIVNQQGVFYISQAEYIEYEIAKREAVKRALKRKKRGNILYNASLWMLKTIFSIFMLCLVCWSFYFLCWSMQKTF